MVQQIIIKLLFNSFICLLFVNILIHLFKSTILIEFDDNRIKKNISL